MRNIPQEPPLGTDQVFESTSHGIEVVGKLSDFIAPTIYGSPNTRREIAGAETKSRPTQGSDWRR